MKPPDATELRRLLVSGDISPGEVLEESRARLAAVNAVLNAVIHEEEPVVTTDLEPPLAGVPVVVKDLGCEQRGRPDHRGARFLRDLGWTSPDDSFLWSRLERAGVMCLGRTNTPEFGTTIVTEPLAYGPTRNPWSLGHTPGGSSGGSAAAVAAGVVPIAHGNDGGGSLRIPASACGLVGLKPTRGRVSTGPQRGEHRGGFAVDGVLTRTVRDTALAFDVIAGCEPGDPYSAPLLEQPLVEAVQTEPPRLRIARSALRAHPACVTAVDDTCRVLQDLGHEVIDAEPTGWYDRELADHTIVLRTVAMARELAVWEAQLGRTLTDDDVEPNNLWSAQLGRTIDAPTYLDAQQALNHWSRTAMSFFTEVDLLVTPVLGGPPPLIGELSDPEEGPARVRDLIGFVDQANVTGQPAVSIPVARTSDGLPIGVQLLASHGREGLLVSASASLEATMGWPTDTAEVVQ